MSGLHEPVLVGQGLHGVRPLPISSPARTAAQQEAKGPRKLRALILAPTREMASQIGETVKHLTSGTSLKFCVVFGGVNPWPQTQELRSGVDLLIATPVRLMELLTQGYVHLNHVAMFVLDEVDRLLETGHAGDIRKIVQSLPPLHQTALFTETVTEPVEDLAATILKNPAYIRVKPPLPGGPRVHHAVCFVAQREKIKALAQLLQTGDVTKAIVFTKTQQRADRVAEQLLRMGLRAEALAKPADARKALKSDRKAILVATDVAARGVDVSGMSHVVNFDMPLKAEFYANRVGKSAQGPGGQAISLCDDEERKLLKAIEKTLGKSLPTRKIELTAAVAKGAVPVSRPSPEAASVEPAAAVRPSPKASPSAKTTVGTKSGSNAKSAPVAVSATRVAANGSAKKSGPSGKTAAVAKPPSRGQVGAVTRRQPASKPTSKPVAAGKVGSKPAKAPVTRKVKTPSVAAKPATRSTAGKTATGAKPRTKAMGNGRSPRQAQAKGRGRS
jgi:ATP-dependent RNA helicase RhlE